MSEQRSLERLRVHYEVEKALANQLRSASPTERRRLYPSLYDELFRRVPDHPQLTRRVSLRERQQTTAREFAHVRRFLKADTRFLEVGAGDCALSFRAAGIVKRVFALDVSAEIARRASPPENFQLVLSDGCNIPVPPGSIDVAYSNQLMEHLHPDDASRQLRDIHQALVPGGAYLCLTPNRLNGPHDISKYFDPVATGFHLKEYTTTELNDEFQRAGFSRIGVLVSLGGLRLVLPVDPFCLLERIVTRLPPARRRRISAAPPVRWLLGIRLVGLK